MKRAIWRARLWLMDRFFELAYALDPGHRWEHEDDGNTITYFRIPAEKER